MKRVARVIRIRHEKFEEYKQLHANPWPCLIELMRKHNFHNFSVYYRDGLLFSYYEYTGKNQEADMKNLMADPVNQAWLRLTDPCQEPVETAAEGEWWAPMEELFHYD